MVVNILGTEYTVNLVTEQAEPRLEGCDGFCDETTKEIVVENYKRGQQGEKGRLEIQEKKNIRHEIVHAFCLKADWLRIASGRRTRNGRLVCLSGSQDLCGLSSGRSDLR